MSDSTEVESSSDPWGCENELDAVERLDESADENEWRQTEDGSADELDE